LRPKEIVKSTKPVQPVQTQAQANGKHSRYPDTPETDVFSPPENRHSQKERKLSSIVLQFLGAFDVNFRECIILISLERHPFSAA